MTVLSVAQEEGNDERIELDGFLSEKRRYNVSAVPTRSGSTNEAV